VTLSDTSFGPSALATPANAVTITRLLLAIPLLMLIADNPSSWPATVLWIILCITDSCWARW
jgi:CDP-diacylglycerol--glycerol-3-phosphate 3-phosphatidyltransferase